MSRIKVILHYEVGTESEDLKFDDIDGDDLGSDIGQSSALEIINCLDEMDKMAKVILVDDSGRVIKFKFVKIKF